MTTTEPHAVEPGALEPHAVVTRFAPSPTGPLHLGHAFAAVRARDAAGANGAICRLRLDNLDPARARGEHEAAVRRQLDWLGLTFDGPVVRQSERVAAYDEALAGLAEAGLAYRCRCTRADIAAAVAAPHGVGSHGAEPDRYPGTCRTAMVERHEPHAWRLNAGLVTKRVGRVTWREGAAERTVSAQDLDDIVLRRRDGAAAYHLATVVDDAAMGVTLVVRGADLAPSAPVQALLRAALGLSEPTHRHHPLVAGPDGRRLATRDRAASLDTLADPLAAGGWSGPALAALLKEGRVPLPYSLVRS